MDRLPPPSPPSPPERGHAVEPELLGSTPRRGIVYTEAGREAHTGLFLLLGLLLAHLLLIRLFLLFAIKEVPWQEALVMALLPPVVLWALIYTQRPGLRDNWQRVRGQLRLLRHGEAVAGVTLGSERRTGNRPGRRTVTYAYPLPDGGEGRGTVEVGREYARACRRGATFTVLRDPADPAHAEPYFALDGAEITGAAVEAALRGAPPGAAHAVEPELLGPVPRRTEHTGKVHALRIILWNGVVGAALFAHWLTGRDDVATFNVWLLAVFAGALLVALCAFEAELARQRAWLRYGLPVAGVLLLEGRAAYPAGAWKRQSVPAYDMTGRRRGTTVTLLALPGSPRSEPRHYTRCRGWVRLVGAPDRP